MGNILLYWVNITRTLFLNSMNIYYIYYHKTMRIRTLISYITFHMLYMNSCNNWDKISWLFDC